MPASPVAIQDGGTGVHSAALATAAHGLGLRGDAVLVGVALQFAREDSRCGYREQRDSPAGSTRGTSQVYRRSMLRPSRFRRAA